MKNLQSVPKNRRFLRITVQHIVICLLLISTLSICQANDEGDILFFGVTNDDGTITYATYDPINKVKQPVNSMVAGDQILVSSQGLVAFTSETGEDTDEIIVIDLKNPESPPIHINPDPDIVKQNRPLAWSLDGSSLAFVSKYSLSIYVWDGQTTVNITPERIGELLSVYMIPWGVSETEWSQDGQLAFVIAFEKNRFPQEIFVWDGNTSHTLSRSLATGYRELTWSQDGRLAYIGFDLSFETQEQDIFLWDGSSPVNFSQNPTNYAGNPSWSADGQLAFMTSDDETDILVWDGVSFKDGVPDTDTFVEVTSDLTIWPPTSRVWNKANHLTFEAVGPQDEYLQVYSWDGNSIVNLSQNPDSHCLGPTWTDDGYWAFTTAFFGEGTTYVRDANNQTVLTLQTYTFPAWSSDGHLAFCTDEGLSVWNRDEIIEVAQGQLTQIRWLSGVKVYCDQP